MMSCISVRVDGISKDQMTDEVIKALESRKEDWELHKKEAFADENTEMEEKYIEALETAIERLKETPWGEEE